MTSYRQIFRNLSLLGSAQFVNVLLAVGRNKLAALFIGVAGMGLADIYARLVETMSGFSHFGIGLTAVRRLTALHEQGVCAARLERHVALVRSWGLVLALAGSLLTLALCLPLSLLLTGSSAEAPAFALLSPAVGFSVLTFCEIALLRAFKCLRQLALSTIVSAAFTLAITALLYGLWGQRSIVWATLLFLFTGWASAFWFTHRLFPYRTGRMAWRRLREGMPMLRLGAAYVVAGTVTSLCELLVRSLLMRRGDGLATVGLYAAGFTLTMSYTRILFSAMDSDFFPRLTAVVHSRDAAYVTINRQITLMAVLVAPLLLVFAALLPVVIRLLYTPDFIAVEPMVTAALGAVYCKAVYTPMAYLPLARGDSKLYMTMELTYNVAFVAFVVGGYTLGGLAGAGLGLTLAHLCDLLMLHTVYRRRYGYRMNLDTALRSLFLGLCLAAGLAALYLAPTPGRYTLAALALVAMVPAVWRVAKRMK